MKKDTYDIRHDMNDLKKLVLDLMNERGESDLSEHAPIIRKLYQNEDGTISEKKSPSAPAIQVEPYNKENILDMEEFVEESLSLEDKKVELIRKALEKHHGKRKFAAQELGISERTLYRKIKEYNIDDEK
jgi:transcriptional regulator with PAS, ATPase and Fis domain